MSCRVEEEQAKQASPTSSIVLKCSLNLASNVQMKETAQNVAAQKQGIIGQVAHNAAYQQQFLMLNTQNIQTAYCRQWRAGPHRAGQADRVGQADRAGQGRFRQDVLRQGSSRHGKQEQLTLSHVLEGYSIHDALLHTHAVRSGCAIVNGRAGLLRVEGFEHQHCQGGQYKPETPQVAHSNPDPLPAASNLLACCARLCSAGLQCGTLRLHAVMCCSVSVHC